eukprot:1161263-Pelagomonas_calceolata.AAC.40
MNGRLSPPTMDQISTQSCPGQADLSSALDRHHSTKLRILSIQEDIGARASTSSLVIWLSWSM